MQKIIVVESERLLGAAIISLLQRERNLYIMGLAPNTTSALIEKINHIQPDVVIVDLTSHFADVLQRLPVRASFRLILINIEDNWVFIDNKHRVLIKKPIDLARLVHSAEEQLTLEKVTVKL